MMKTTLAAIPQDRLTTAWKTRSLMQRHVVPEEALISHYQMCDALDITVESLSHILDHPVEMSAQEYRALRHPFTLRTGREVRRFVECIVRKQVDSPPMTFLTFSSPSAFVVASHPIDTKMQMLLPGYSVLAVSTRGSQPKSKKLPKSAITDFLTAAHGLPLWLPQPKSEAEWQQWLKCRILETASNSPEKSKACKPPISSAKLLEILCITTRSVDGRLEEDQSLDMREAILMSFSSAIMRDGAWRKYDHFESELEALSRKQLHLLFCYLKMMTRIYDRNPEDPTLLVKARQICQ